MPKSDHVVYAEIYKQLWEAMYVGETCFLTSGHFKAAHELWTSGITPDEFAQRLKVYFGNEFYGGESCRHSLFAFVKNINSFIPPKKRKEANKAYELEFCHTHDVTYRLGFGCPECNKEKILK
jgi:hypothetical protein